MEIIQQFGENESYLYAIRSQSTMLVNISLPNPTAAELRTIQCERGAESLEQLLKEPLGRFFFHHFLRDCGCLEMLLFVNECNEFAELPPGKYRFMFARSIYKKYLHSQSVNLNQTGLNSAANPFVEQKIMLNDPITKRVIAHFLKVAQIDYNHQLIDEFQYETHPLDAHSLSSPIKQNEFDQHATIQGEDGNVIERAIELGSKSTENLSSDLFERARRCVYRDLQLFALPNFMQSHFYNRLNAFRIQEQRQVTRDQFHFIRVLGRGGFGKVYAVAKIDTKAVYACKAIDKEKVIHRKREKLLMNERYVLSKVRHPFIISLNYAFQDALNLYFVIDLVTGGDLNFHLKRLGRLRDSWVNFFAAGIVMAIEHLHKNNFVYRDLKPENVMIDADGYIRLTDMGLCAEIRPGQKLNEHCGTRSFMAPEQCLSSYGKEVDWWSLGVVLYLLLTGRNPFWRSHWMEKKKKEGIMSSFLSKSRKKFDTFMQRSTKKMNEIVPTDGATTTRHSRGGMKPNRKIFPVSTPKSGERDDHPNVDEDNNNNSNDSDIQDKRQQRIALLNKLYEETLADMKWPDWLNPNAKSLIQLLLQKQPMQRLGVKGAQEIRSHPYFKHVDWDKLRRRHITPPFVPNCNSVNAEYVETAELIGSSDHRRGEYLENFDYTARHIYQHEVLTCIHDENDLLHYVKHRQS